MHAQLPKPLATHPPSPHHTVTRGKTQGAGKPSCQSPLPSKPGFLFSICFPRKRRSFCCYKKPSQLLASSRERAQKVPAHVVRARRAAGSQRGGSSWETFTNLDICSLKLPSDSWDREGSAFTAPQCGRGWFSSTRLWRRRTQCRSGEGAQHPPERGCLQVAGDKRTHRHV